MQIKKNIQWFIDNVGNGEVVAMGQRGHDYLIENLTREKSVKKYAEEISRA